MTTTPERSVEEIIDENAQHGKLDGDLETTQYIPVSIFLKTLQAERQKREEMVEVAHMAGYYSCCKRDSSYSEARNYRETITQPNNPK